jgi:hypothetical protein
MAAYTSDAICSQYMNSSCSNYFVKQGSAHVKLERVKGIEPSSSAWKAVALPLSYTRALGTPVLRERLAVAKRLRRAAFALSGLAG